jgi:hypothetical protein
MGLTRLTIPRYERALLWKNRRFTGVLGPGVQWIVAPFTPLTVHMYDATVPEFEHPRVDLLMSEPRATLREHLQIVEVGEQEIGVVYKNGKLDGVLAPGKRQLYWKGPVQVRVDKIHLSRVHELPAAVAQLLPHAIVSAQVVDARS